MVRDLPAGGRPVVLVWRKRRWRCPDPGCGVKSWTEASPEVRARSVLSERARREAVRQVGQDGMPVAAAARGLGVSWHTAMNAVREIGGSMVDAQTGGLRGVRRLGMGRGAAGGNARAGGCRGSAASTQGGWWKSSRAVPGCGQGLLQPPARRRQGLRPSGGPRPLAGVSGGGAERTPRRGSNSRPVPHDPPGQPGPHRGAAAHPARNPQPPRAERRSPLRDPPSVGLRTGTAHRPPTGEDQRRPRWRPTARSAQLGKRRNSSGRSTPPRTPPAPGSGSRASTGGPGSSPCPKPNGCPAR